MQSTQHGVSFQNYITFYTNKPLYKIWSVNINRLLFGYKRLNSCAASLLLKSTRALKFKHEVIKKPYFVLSKMYFIYSWSRYALMNKQESASWKLDSFWNILSREIVLDRNWSIGIPFRALMITENSSLKYIAEINSISLLWLGCMEFMCNQSMHDILENVR